MDQLEELKRLRLKNERIRQAASDLFLHQLIPSEAARRNGGAPQAVEFALTIFAMSWTFPSVEFARCFALIA